MNAGQLRHRIQVQRKQVTRSATGAEVVSWLPVFAAWAKVETPTGREFVELARAGAEVTHKVTVRYRQGVKPEMRLAWDGRTLEIGAVLSDNRKREMTLMCSEAV